VGTQTQDNNPYTDFPTPATQPQRGILHPQNQHLCNSKEAAQTQQLLQEGVVKEIEALYHPSFDIEPSNSEAPNPLWFAKPDIPTIPIVLTINTNWETIELPYIRYALINNEPMLLGTKKRAEEVFGDYLCAGPKHHLPLPFNIDNAAIEDPYTDYLFNWTLNLALYHLGDAGIIANIYQFRSAYLKLKFMKKESKRLA
jgi:hypothetical protein